MGRALSKRLIGSAVLLLLLHADNAGAQYFGRNKVQYDRETVLVLTTEHFDVYHSREDAEAAPIAGRLAERWYERLSRVLDHELRGRQPIVLYGSHRRFEQTNVYGGLIDESTGGFTDSRKRRIVMPFSGSLAETDHVLGHEIVHAFQFDMADQHRSTLAVPLWFLEGMAEYLTLGADDPQTAMWMRDAVASGTLPSIRDLSSPRYFPYRWGAAVWSHLVEEYGADFPARALRAKRDVRKRFEEMTGKTLDELTAAWHDSLRLRYAAAEVETPSRAPLISSQEGGGRLNVAASLSPDGRHMVFLSERDQFSIDLYLADAATGRTIRKLITTAATADLESLQYLHSAGAWDRGGERFAVATIRRGQATLLLLDVWHPSRSREVPLPDVDEVYSPTWSPDGRTVAFSAMRSGRTDLYALDLESGTLRRLVNDRYADLQPAWSPDGRTIAFATDRFTTNLAQMKFGDLRIGLLDVETGNISAAPALPGSGHLDPAWAPGGGSLYVVADPDGVRNVYRLELAGGQVYRVTDVPTGVSGVTRSSPVLSVASGTGALAYSVFRRGAYEVHRVEAEEALAGEPLALGTIADSRLTPDTPLALDGGAGPVQESPAMVSGTVSAQESYRPRLSLEAVGSPYFSAGGGPLGDYVAGGASLLFGDLLGNQQIMTSAYVSSRLEESAVGALYVNRSHRWNWGVTLEQSPQLRFRTTNVAVGEARENTVAVERERSIWTNRQLGGIAAYPFNRSQRVEFSAGFRQIAFHREYRTDLISRASGMLVESRLDARTAEPSIGLAEGGVALVGDTAIFGATGPMLGRRYRFQASTTAGGLKYASVLADYRQYLMPVRPFTLAMRLVHSGRYGGDAGDFRLRDAYLGSPTLVRGYGAADVLRAECPAGSADCPALNTLLANRVVAAKIELRVPVWSWVTSSSQVRYGPIPMDGFLFADAGAGWGGERRFGPGGSDGRLVRSVGAGVRVSALGMIVELATIRALDLKGAGWSFGFNLQPGF